MDLVEAILSDTEFAPWAGGLAPVTVLLVPEGLDPDACAARVRERLGAAGTNAVHVPSSAIGSEDLDGFDVRIFSGPMEAATGRALAHDGSIVITAFEDVWAAASALRTAARLARHQPGLSSHAGRSDLDPSLQFADDRIQIVAALADGPSGEPVLDHGLFFDVSLQEPPRPYIPGNPWRANGHTVRSLRESHEIPARDEPSRRPIRVDLGKLADKLRRNLRSAFLPVWREGRADDPDILDGTCPVTFIPEGTEWPSRDGNPFAPVLHLDVASMPEPARALLGRETGLFQFFCWIGYDEEQRSFLARVVDPKGPGEWRSFPGGTEHEGGPERRVITGWREVCEGPDGVEFSEGRVRLTEAQDVAVDALSSHTIHTPRLTEAEVLDSAKLNGLAPERAKEVAALLEHHDSDKLLGWPSWTQAPEWPTGRGSRDMALLLQLSFDHPEAIAPSLIAADGTLQLFVSTSGERRFAMAWACT